jgi:hypothetical protein
MVKLAHRETTRDPSQIVGTNICVPTRTSQGGEMIEKRAGLVKI